MKTIFYRFLLLSVFALGVHLPQIHAQAGDYIVTENQQSQNAVSGASITYIPRSWKNPLGGYYVYTLWAFCWEQTCVRPEIWTIRMKKTGAGYLKKGPGGFVMVGDQPGSLISNGSGYSFLEASGQTGGTWDPISDFEDLLKSEYDYITQNIPEC